MLEIAGILAGIVLAQMSPGPNMMAVMSAALGSGRMSGIVTAAGIATGVLFWAVLSTLGIGAILIAVPETVTAMRFLGGGYLLYLGLKALRATFSPSSQRPVETCVEARAGAAYRRGLLIALTNPKAALVWSAISMYLASSGFTAAQFLIIDIGASASAMAVYGAYALVFSTGIVMRVYARFFRAIDASFGAIFGVIGARLLIDGVRELKA